MEEQNVNPRTKRERFFDAILQSAIDYAIISLDLDGLVTSWNEGEIICKPATVFFSIEDWQAGIPQQEMATALTKGDGSDERWHLKKDGSFFWASGQMMALRSEDGTVEGFVK